MSEEKLEEIYFSLSALLDDICKFLKDEVNQDALDPEARKLADSLISRSKVQLKNIVTLTNGSDEEEYVQIENPITENDREDSARDVILEDETICPYLEFPVKDLPFEEKSGYLFVKTKFIIFLERIRKVYAGIIGHWLLLYGNGKTSKPSHVYNLKLHTASVKVEDKQYEDTVQCFFLINFKTRETWQFEAQTNKDMLQWIACINKCSQYQPTTTQRFSQIKEQFDDNEETYDEVGRPKSEEEDNKNDADDDDEESIYADLGPSSQPQKETTVPLPKPPTPNISTIPTRQVPPAPIQDEHTSRQLGFTPSISFDGELESTNDSFSEENGDSDDSTYAPISTVKPPPPIRKSITRIPKDEKPSEIISFSNQEKKKKESLIDQTKLPPGLDGTATISSTKIDTQTRTAKGEIQKLNFRTRTGSHSSAHVPTNSCIQLRIAKLETQTLPNTVEAEGFVVPLPPSKTGIQRKMIKRGSPDPPSISTKPAAQLKTIRRDVLPPPPPSDHECATIFTDSIKQALRSRNVRNDPPVALPSPVDPSLPTKPVVQARIVKHTANGKPTTKQVLKSVKESSSK